MEIEKERWETSVVDSRLVGSTIVSFRETEDNDDEWLLFWLVFMLFWLSEICERHRRSWRESTGANRSGQDFDRTSEFDDWHGARVVARRRFEQISPIRLSREAGRTARCDRRSSYWYCCIWSIRAQPDGLMSRVKTMVKLFNRGRLNNERIGWFSLDNHRNWLIIVVFRLIKSWFCWDENPPDSKCER